ncbi:hypothetical protein WAE58_04615 [Pedobacter panaciterrae]|uniref:PilZ domain-containing protein n=1 Tax=Pedobacter panaciterrae TaxID=363849 RepID=A0ABU8NJQ3_9SPHI
MKDILMKAGCGKTARPVCAADGGKAVEGRLLRPDSVEVPVMGMERRGCINTLSISGVKLSIQEVTKDESKTLVPRSVLV